MIELSVVIPSIRANKWEKIYYSLLGATNRNFEIIFVGPCSMPENLEQFRNIKTVRSFGSPVLCMQIGVINSCGKYILWTSDDGVFIKGSIDNLFSSSDKINVEDSYVTCKYYEGINRDELDSGETDHIMMNEQYYTLNFHNDTRNVMFLDSWYGLNIVFGKTDSIKSYGGLDCRFETPSMGASDLAIRIQRNNGIIRPSENPVFKCNWMPNNDGDHGPIHSAHFDNDLPLLHSLSTQQNRIHIDICNWMSVDQTWRRRYAT